MSATEQLRAPSDYSDIAALQGRRNLLYVTDGDYQGEWMMFAIGDDGYAIYRDWYGSCSGCDELQAEFSYGGELYDAERVMKFVNNYRPFVIIPRETARNLALNRSMLSVFPANVRDASINTEQFARECALIVKLEEEMAFDDPSEAFETQNMETRRRIMERVGIGFFVDEVLHVDGRDRLVRIGETDRYLHLQDASTDREYLLRVPPETRTVRGGKAWSFELSLEEYKPIIET